MPSLPIDYIKFSVPYNAANFSVSAAKSNNMNALPSHLVYPCQPERPMNDTTAIVIVPPDSLTYSSNSFYPSLASWVVDEGYLAGESHIVTVAVMPVSYKHYIGPKAISHQVCLSRTINLTLNFELSDSLEIQPIVRKDTAMRNEEYRLVQSMVANPDNVKLFAPPINIPDSLIINPMLQGGTSPSSGGKDIDPNPGTLERAHYPYLIITTPELLHSVRRIAALKRQKGYSVKVMTLHDAINHPYACRGDIIHKSDGRDIVAFSDDAGKLRQFLKYAFACYDTKFVLLAGSDIPYRKYGGNTPTDMYFCDLNGDWTGQNIDLNSELFVGRILAKGANQISNYIDKLMRYELNPGRGDFSYLSRALYTESIDMTGHASSLGEYMNAIFPDTTVMNESRGHKYPKGCDVLNTINTRQFGFWSTSNHGEASNIVTYGVSWGSAYTSTYRLWALDSVKHGESEYITDENGNGLDCMVNKDYPMISYSISCTTMPYDILIYNEHPIEVNFGESFTTGKDYGGPAYLGNTRVGYITSSHDLEICFAKLLRQGYFKLGEAECLSKSAFSGKTFDRYLAATHNLLGDPSIEIWTSNPEQYQSIAISRTNSSITITGIDADSTIVTCVGNDRQQCTNTISVSSITLPGVSPNSSIMIYKHNHIPYIAPMLLQNAILTNSQYVIASDVVAGNSVDVNRTPGDVIVSEGVEYEIEASGKVILERGFKVEKGALFSVYPSCF